MSKELAGPNGPVAVLDIPNGIGLMPNGNIDSNRAAAMYLKMKGQKQGDIKGGMTEKGQENLIKVYGLLHGLTSPRDAASGLPTGKRRHGVLQISIGLDKSIPLIYNALVNNENLTSWQLKYWSAVHKGSVSTATGTGHANIYTIDLVNANVANIESITTVNGAIMFLLGFTYQKITWTWVDGGITANDDWEAPVA
jgi:type VI secretion system secreted protein Hcp